MPVLKTYAKKKKQTSSGESLSTTLESQYSMQEPRHVESPPPTTQEKPADMTANEKFPVHSETSDSLQNVSLDPHDAQKSAEEEPQENFFLSDNQDVPEKSIKNTQNKSIIRARSSYVKAASTSKQASQKLDAFSQIHTATAPPSAQPKAFYFANHSSPPRTQLSNNTTNAGSDFSTRVSDLDDFITLSHVSQAVSVFFR